MPLRVVALEAGAHVMVEKPMAMRVLDAAYHSAASGKAEAI